MMLKPFAMLFSHLILMSFSFNKAGSLNVGFFSTGKKHCTLTELSESMKGRAHTLQEGGRSTEVRLATRGLRKILGRQVLGPWTHLTVWKTVLGTTITWLAWDSTCGEEGSLDSWSQDSSQHSAPSPSSSQPAWRESYQLHLCNASARKARIIPI